MSLTFYFCVYATLVVLAILSPKNRRINFCLLSVLFVVLLIPSWRLEGMDRDVYLSSMDGTSVCPIAEMSFYHVCRLTSCLGSDERLLFLVYAAISVGGTLFILYVRNCRLWWGVLVYYSHFYVLHGMIQIRCGNSVLFFLVFLMLWNTRRPIGKLEGLCAFACSIYWHISGCVGSVALFLRRNRFSSSFYLTLIAICVVAYVCGLTFTPLLSKINLSIIQECIGKYNAAMDVGKELDYHVLGIWRIAKLTLAVACLAFSARVVRFARTSSLLKIWIFGLCIGLVLSDFPSVAGRMSDYLESVEYILVPAAAFAICSRMGGLIVVLYSLCTMICDIIKSDLIPL